MKNRNTKDARILLLMLVVSAAVGMLIQCGAPADLLGKVEKKVEEAQAGEVAPEAPSELTATQQSTSQIDLTWSDNSDNEEAFELQRKKESGGTYATIDNNIAAGTTGYQDVGLDSETGHYYRIRAVNSVGESSWSNEASDTTDQLAAPRDLTATAVSDTRIDLSWTDNSSFESGFEIERNSTVIYTADAETQTYSDTGLSAETQYSYRVRAVDAGGFSSWSGQASAITPGPGDAKNFSVSGIAWNMCYVPAKTFPTGTDDNGSATVSTDFWLAETEVTYELWNAVYSWATVNGYDFEQTGIPGHDGASGIETTSQEPVTTVNWRDAMVWCNALTEWYNDQNSTGYTTVYNDSGTPIRDSRYENRTQCNNVTPNGAATGFRLFTSDEWELAARWGGFPNAVSGYSDPWFTTGNSASGAFTFYNDEADGNLNDVVDNKDYNDDVAVYGYYYDGGWEPTGVSGTAVVKSKSANSLGLYDMSGNVSEWSFDLHPWANPPDNYLRVLRGGNWNLNASYLQVGKEAFDNPYTCDSWRGFRFARSAR
jgi:formylglycine-generating enzyme required for sulfatase activity